MLDSGRRRDTIGNCLLENRLEEALFIEGLKLRALLVARWPPAFVLDARLSADAEEAARDLADCNERFRTG